MPAVLIAILVLTLSSPRALAQAEQAPEPAACPERARVESDQNELAERTRAVDRKLSELSLDWPLGILGVSVATVVLSAALVGMYGEPHNQALWTIPGVATVGVVGSAIAFGVRMHARRPFRREQRRLAAQRTRLDFERETIALYGCSSDALVERDARLMLTRVEEQMAAIRARAEQVPLRVPHALFLTGAILSAGTVFASGFAALYIEVHGDGVQERRLLWGLLGSAGGSLVLLGAAGAWRARRRAERARISEPIKALDQERRRLNTVLTPLAGPTSVGLSLSGRF